MKSSGRPHDLERAIPFLLARTGARMGNAFSKALKPFAGVVTLPGDPEAREPGSSKAGEQPS